MRNFVIDQAGSQSYYSFAFLLFKLHYDEKPIQQLNFLVFTNVDNIHLLLKFIRGNSCEMKIFFQLRIGRPA